MDYIYIGKIVNTHGIKSELRIISDFDRKDLIFKPDFNLYIGQNYIKEKILTYRKHKSFDMVMFAGYNNINQVLKYIGLPVYVKREELNLKDDYILEDLIGLEVFENGELLGKVSKIVYNSSNILLYIEAKHNFYIPHNKNFIKKVDLNNGTIEVLNAKGLILWK